MNFKTFEGNSGDVWKYVFTKKDMFVSQMYLIQPDSWKKLEEDLDKCFSSNNSCYYLSKSGECCDCILAPNEVGRTCDAAIFSSIKERICKLRKKDNS